MAFFCDDSNMAQYSNVEQRYHFRQWSKVRCCNGEWYRPHDRRCNYGSDFLLHSSSMVRLILIEHSRDLLWCRAYMFCPGPLHAYSRLVDDTISVAITSRAEGTQVCPPLTFLHGLSWLHACFPFLHRWYWSSKGTLYWQATFSSVNWLQGSLPLLLRLWDCHFLHESAHRTTSRALNLRGTSNLVSRYLYACGKCRTTFFLLFENIAYDSSHTRRITHFLAADLWLSVFRLFCCGGRLERKPRRQLAREQFMAFCTLRIASTSCCFRSTRTWYLAWNVDRRLLPCNCQPQNQIGAHLHHSMQLSIHWS